MSISELSEVQNELEESDIKLDSVSDIELLEMDVLGIDDILTIEKDTDDLLPEFNEKNLEEQFQNKVDELDISQEMKSIVDQNVQPLVIPQSHGHWEGEPGTSKFVMDDDYVPTGRGVNPESLTMGELKEKYDFDGVEYKNKEPDFSQFADNEIGAVSLDKFSSVRTGKGGTYDLAITKAAEQQGISPNEIKDMMDERGLTWHEVGDRKTVLPIPTEINAAFKHSGGISIEKNIDALGDYLNDEYGKLSLSRTSPADNAQDIEIDVEAAQKQIHSDVKEHKTSNN